VGSAERFSYLHANRPYRGANVNVGSNHGSQVLRGTNYRERGVIMPKFVIEREIPKAGSLSQQQLQEISQKSCGVLRSMGPQIQWVQSYVTDDKIYCVYVAPSEDAVREHAKQGGFPANRISQIRSVIDPTTAELKT
jgi:uncharacterized protein DUF4242